MKDNTRETEIQNVLRNEHERRQTEITDLLRSNGKPEDYLRRMDREDKRYGKMMVAVQDYFLSADEWKEKHANDIVVGS